VRDGRSGLVVFPPGEPDRPGDPGHERYFDDAGRRLGFEAGKQRDTEPGGDQPAHGVGFLPLEGDLRFETGCGAQVVGDLAQAVTGLEHHELLVGEVLEVRPANISHEIVGGHGRLRVDDVLDAELEPFRAADGTITTLRDSLFSTVPGSPAYVANAIKNKVDLPEYGLTWEFSNRNAIQADYKMEFAG